MVVIMTNQPQPLPSAILWDYDGTLLDTEPIWVEAEIALLAERGTKWTHEQGAQLAGMSWLDASNALIAEIGDETIDPYEFYLRRIHAVADWVRECDELPWRPGARELFEQIAAAGIPMGLVSASAQILLDAGLDRIGHDRFDVIVDGDAVANGKPDPEGYLLAASKLGVDPRDCLVIEDSVSGAAAGRASGALVVAVPCMTPLAEAPGQVIVDTLEGRDLDWLSKLWATERGER